MSTALLAVVCAAGAATALTADLSRGRLATLQAGSPSRPLPWWVLGLLPGLLAGPAAALLGLGAAVILRQALLARGRSRAVAEERRRALAALAVLAADLRAGRAPAEALAAAGQTACGGTAAALTAAAAAAEVAGDVPAALAAGGGVVPDVLRALAACWSVTAVSGSGLAAGVERLAEALRAAAAQRRALEAELAGPRATAGLLAVLPLAGIALAGALGADPLHVLLHTTGGVACLLCGLGLDLAGVLWTRRLVARVAPP